MEYKFKFRYDREGDGMVFNKDNSIGGIINSVGTMVLSFKPKDLKKDFLKYCDENKIKYRKFLGSDEIYVVNYKDFEVEDIPKSYFIWKF